MSAYQLAKQELRTHPRTWLVTGAAGFIGSHLVETLLRLEQSVIGLDNLSTGTAANLDQVAAAVGPNEWRRFSFVEGDVRNSETCRSAATEVDFVLHHAADSSVPESLKHPVATHDTNVIGFLNVLTAARDKRVQRVVYASSSAVYGNNARAVQIETDLGEPISPYAASKQIGEIYATTFRNAYSVDAVGLRYFNAFGPRQPAASAYPAVIPAWLQAIETGEPLFVNGDGTTTRDFCHVADVVQANVLAATVVSRKDCIFNIGLGRETSLNDLFELLRDSIGIASGTRRKINGPIYRDFRLGDIQRSRADITRAVAQLGYQPAISLDSGLVETARWFLRQSAEKHRAAVVH